MKKAIEMLKATAAFKSPRKDTPSGAMIMKRAKGCTIAQFISKVDYDMHNRPHAYCIGKVVCPPPNGSGKAHQVEARLYAPWGTTQSPTYLACDCGNFRYCVGPDTLVNTEHGLVPIKYLEGSKLQALTQEGQKEATIISSGTATTVRVRTSRGFELRATENERLLVLQPDLTTAWRRVDELVAGDYLVFQPGFARNKTEPVRLDFEYVPSTRPSYFRSIAGKRTKITGHEVHNYREYQVPKELLPELARILGYLVAEGSTDKNTISFPQKDREVMDDFLSCWHACFSDCDLTANKETNGTPIAEIRSVYLVQFLQQLGYDPHWRSDTKQVPEVLFRSRMSDIREFLRGLFEGDGWCTVNQVGYDSDSEKLIEQVQQLLLLFGVVSSRSRNSLWFGGVYAQRFCEQVGFVSQRKQSALTLEDVSGRTVPYVHSLLQSCLKPAGYYEIQGQRQRLNIYHKTLQKSESRAGGMYEKTVRQYLESHPDFKVAYPEIQECIRSLLDSDLEWDAVEDVGDPQTMETYDAVVPSIEHYVGNGFVIHNTWEVALQETYSSSNRCSDGSQPTKRNPSKVPALCKHLVRFLQYATRSRDVQKKIAEIPVEEIKKSKRKMNLRAYPKRVPKRGVSCPPNPKKGKKRSTKKRPTIRGRSRRSR